jgi:hypothetical protein
LLVAGNAGIRGSPLSILTTEVIHHIGLELRLKVEPVEGDAKEVTHFTGIIDIPDRAAGRAGRGETMALLTPQLHRNAQDFIPCLLEQSGR